MLALIPLRGGSKGLPGKNIKMCAGKPLCQWVIDEAKKAVIFDRIIVSTDSEEIAGVVYSYNQASVDVMMRPAELAQDDTPTEAVMLDVAKTEDFRRICLIQATSPLTIASDFQAARAKFLSLGCCALLTVTELKKFVWRESWAKGCVEPINYNPRNRPMREGIKPLYVETGNFYMTYKETLVRTGSRLGGSVGRYIIEPERAVDIDTMADFEKAEQLLRRREDEVSGM